MSQIQERPFATRTEGELFLMSEFLEREIKSMSEKNSLVQAEMRFRAQAEAAGSASPASATAQDSTLNSYEDQSKAYAIRISLIGIGILLAAAVVVWFVA